MSNIKLKFKASNINNKTGRIYYQILCNKTVRQISTKHRIFNEEWDKDNETIKIPTNNDIRYSEIITILELIKHDFNNLNKIIISKKLKSKHFTADEIVHNFKIKEQGVTLQNFMQKIINNFIELHKVRSIETYTSTLKSFMRFRKGEDILLKNLNSSLMVNYQMYLKCTSVTMNTISFYMRILRAVYNRAVEENLIEQKYPFKHVYTGIGKTVKRAISINTIRKIKNLDLALSPQIQFARDMFLFSFYTRGMSFIDMAYLEKNNLKNGILSYRRRKTGQLLYIKWEKCMQDIINKYPLNEEKYLLPIIIDSNGDERYYYQKVLSKVNTQLKKISKILSLKIPLTMYVARHSWASIAKSSHIPISVISEGLGHNSESTTLIYLASLDTAIIDKANSEILKLL